MKLINTVEPEHLRIEDRTELARNGVANGVERDLAAKLAGESLISAFVECFGLSAWIYRFGNVVGPRGTHGAALDFFKKLAKTPDELEVLGDGSQAKPYVFVTDCVDGILFGLDHAKDRRGQ